MPFYANAAKFAFFETTKDNFEYFAVKRIGTKLQFRLNYRVSARNQIEYANKGA